MSRGLANSLMHSSADTTSTTHGNAGAARQIKLPNLYHVLLYYGSLLARSRACRSVEAKVFAQELETHSRDIDKSYTILFSSSREHA